MKADRFLNKIPGIPRILKSFRQSKTLFKNFMRLMALMFVIILLITIFIYRNSNQIIRQELMQTNINTTQNIADSIDNLVMETQYITATLATNKMIQFYLFSGNPEEIFSGFYDRITDQLTSYIHGFEYIHSIYLYTDGSKNFLDINGDHPLYLLKDTSWMPDSETMTGNILIVPRKINNVYPYVITVINRITVNERDGYVVLNLDLHKLPNILDSRDNENQLIFIVSDKSEVLFYKNQADIPENISRYPELSGFHAGTDKNSRFVNDKQRPFVLTQISSRRYDWSYVTISYLKEYTGRLSDLRALLTVFFSMMFAVSICIALFFSMSAFKPIRDILDLLNHPEQWDSSSNKSETDVKYIAQQIVSYIHTNNELSEELKKRLHLLNETRVWALQSQINPHFLFNTLNLIHLTITEDLGYKHPASAMIVSLGKLLRYALKATDLVCIQTELEYTRIFLDILNRRYDNPFQIELSISPDILNAKIPKLLLQPLIENSVYHGIAKHRRPDSGITIRGTRDNYILSGQPTDSVILKIEDNGLGMDAETLSELQSSIIDETEPRGQHVGLKNVAMRLRLLFGDKVHMEIASKEGEGTCITLIFPYTE
mgnify:CR=1 FL=1